MISQLERSVAERKSELRKAAKLTRAAMDEKTLAEISRAVCRQVISMPEFSEADAVFCYAPIGKEIRVDAISNEALRLGKILAFPKCKKNGVMNFFAVKSMQELSSGMLGIREPNESCTEVTPLDFERSICILPALTFDSRGYRLGYGGGYYDRYFAVCPDSVYLVGVCAECLLQKALPHGALDVPVDAVATEKEVLRIEKA